MNEKKKREKNIPVLYGEKSNCCGCSACYSICPVKAIFMEPDEEGFLYPIISEDKCIKCYKCLGVCAFKRDQSKVVDYKKEVKNT